MVQPGRRLALAAAVPAALVGLLWYLSNRTWSAYESQRPLDGQDFDTGDPFGMEEPTAPARPNRTPRGARVRPYRSVPRSAGRASGTGADWSPGSAPPTRPPAS